MTRRYTGHPSPAHQVARRVGVTAAGYTEGVETLDGARLFHGRVPVRRETVPVPVVRAKFERPAPIAMSLLAELERLGPRSVLPPLSHIGRSIGLNTPMEQMTTHVNLHIATLLNRDLIAVWRGVDHGFKGQYAIRIVATGQVLRSRDCPPGVTP